ncbi:hypothetical protein ABZ532_22340 [Streptomyces sp. NPDC019396]|uniref:phosphatase domain-containing putative toxin n=1 Tax=Streptomyces sp. NPDC019396 TaxID=3154687 RepID=UPI0033C1DC8D
MVNRRVPRRLAAAALCLLAVSGTGCAATQRAGGGPPAVPSPAAAGGELIIDFLDTPGLPRHFRTATSPLSPEQGPRPSLTGLRELRLSGSASPSQDGWQAVRRTLPAVPGGRLFDVDLRQETHLYVDGAVVSWYGKDDDANIGKSPEQLLRLQTTRLEELRDWSVIPFAYLPKKSAAAALPPSEGPRTVRTEQETVSPYGFAYRYLPVPDRHMPTPQTADDFVALARTLPADGWLHLHCREGHGRTTTFMAMYDMIKNARRVPLADILRRQYLLGGAGTDLAAEASRAAFLQSFYDYARHNDDGFRSSFTDWLAAHPHPTQNYPLVMLPPWRPGSK